MDTIEDFIDNLSIGDIYWFKNPKISSPDPHPHIYVGMEDDDHVFLICCTSQFDTKKRYFELNELPHETLVRIKDDSGNSLTKDTYVDCNEIYSYDIADLYYEHKIKSGGIVAEAELLQIKEGIEASELLEMDIQKSVLSQFPDDL